MNVLSKLTKWSMAAAVVALTMLTGCETDDVISGDGEGVPEEKSQDIVRGKLFHVIDANNLDQYKLPVAVKGKLNVNAVNNQSSYTFEQREIDGAEYIVFKSVKEQTEPFETACLNLSLTNYPELSRNVLLLFKKNTKTKAGGPLLSCYSEYLGKGTRCYDKVSNITYPVLMYDSIISLPEQYLSVSSTLSSVDMIELSGESFESTMESWAFNVGASFKHTKPGKAKRTETIDGMDFLIDKKKSTSVVSGSFTFGMSGSISSSEAYEYYLNLILVKKAEVGMNMGVFESSDNNTKPDPAFLSLVSPSFWNEVCPPIQTKDGDFNTTDFYDHWGTDVITQGVFGGYNVYLYGRSENSYQESIAVDASASMTKTKPGDGSKEDGQWLAIFKAMNSDYMKLTGDLSYKNENYFKASKSISLQRTIGGNVSLTTDNPQKWLDGFNEGTPETNSDKWSLISYRRASDSKDSLSLLYPIEQVIHNVLAIYDNEVPNKASGDWIALSAAVNNMNALIDAKDEYLNSKAEEMRPKSRLVIADIVMKTGKNGNKKGDIKPFVDASPRDASKQYIYYPMMANGFCPYKPGYAFETSGSEFTVQTDYSDEYWYYALAPEDECDGIVDALFEEKSKIEKVNSYGQFYQSRGTDADNGDGMNTWNYLYVRYFDETIDKPEDKITAIGFYDHKKSVQNIIASTGGSELKRAYTPGELTAWNTFWTSDKVKHNSSYIWNEGGSINYSPLSLKLSTQTLPIRRVNESTVCHPWDWK